MGLRLHAELKTVVSTEVEKPGVLHHQVLPELSRANGRFSHSATSVTIKSRNSSHPNRYEKELIDVHGPADFPNVGPRPRSRTPPSSKRNAGRTSRLRGSAVPQMPH